MSYSLTEKMLKVFETKKKKKRKNIRNGKVENDTCDELWERGKRKNFML